MRRVPDNSRIVVFFLVLFGLVLRLWHLGKPSFWMDEAFSVWMASHTPKEIIQILETDTHPPLFYLFLREWLHAGAKETILRLPFVIFGGINILLIFKIVKKVFDQRMAVLASFLWAGSFLALYSDTQVRMYPMATCLSLLATFIFLEAFHKPGELMWSLYFITGVLGLYTHYYTGLILGAHLLFLVTQRRWKEAGVLSGMFMLSFAPWLYMLDRQFHNIQEGLKNTFSVLKLFDAFSLFLGSYYWFQNDLLNFAADCVGLGVVLFGIFFLRRISIKEMNLIIFLFLVPLLGVTTVSAVTSKHFFFLRYTVLFAPYFYILAALALSRIPRLAAAPLVAVFLMINLGLWDLFVTAPAYERQNWRAASRFLKSRLAVGDVVVFGNFMSIFPLWYYLPHQLEIRYAAGKYMFALIPRNDQNILWVPFDGEMQGSQLAQVFRASKRQWLVLCQERLTDSNGKIPRLFFQSRQPVFSERFLSLDPDENINVFLFDDNARRRS